MITIAITYKHSSIPGIYAIENIYNSKKYVGKSNNVFQRSVVYRNDWKTQRYKQTNRYLQNAIAKYGRDAFKFYALEYADVSAIADLELKWMLELQTIDRAKGYNLRLDSSSLIVIPEETKRRISEQAKLQWANPEKRLTITEGLRNGWKNERRKAEHKERCRKSFQRNVYMIFEPNGNVVQADRQLLKDMKLISVEAQFSIKKSNVVMHKGVWIVRTPYEKI